MDRTLAHVISYHTHNSTELYLYIHHIHLSLPLPLPFSLSTSYDFTESIKRLHTHTTATFDSQSHVLLLPTWVPLVTVGVALYTCTGCWMRVSGVWDAYLLEELLFVLHGVLFHAILQQKQVCCCVFLHGKI